MARLCYFLENLGRVDGVNRVDILDRGFCPADNASVREHSERPGDSDRVETEFDGNSWGGCRAVSGQQMHDSASCQIHQY